MGVTATAALKSHQGHSQSGELRDEPGVSPLNPWRGFMKNRSFYIILLLRLWRHQGAVFPARINSQMLVDGIYTCSGEGEGRFNPLCENLYFQVEKERVIL